MSDTRANSAAAAAADSAPERAFGRYRLLKKIGEGGMGDVWLAHDDRLDRDVAIKLPKSDDEHTLARLRREATAAAALDHAGICTIHDFGEIDGQFYLALAFIKGTSLADVAVRNKALPLAKVAEWVRRIAAALEHAHGKGVIHRDLKPANIMLRPDGSPVVMDFGLARCLASDAPLTVTGMVMGTPQYLPPEQARGDVDEMGPGCDVYSLGVILYELLTGHRPFVGPNLNAVLYQVQTADPPKPSSLRPEIGANLEAICLKAMAKRPEDRFPTMTAFRLALTAYLRDKSAKSPVAAPAPTVVEAVPAVLKARKSPSRTIPVSPQPPRRTTEEKTPPWKKSRTAVLILGAVALLIGLVGLGAWGMIALQPAPSPTSSAFAKPGDEKSFTNPLRMKMVRIPRGTFWMGGGGGKPGDKPVPIPDDFYLGTTEVTQGQWVAVTGGANPSYFSRNGVFKDRVKDVSDADLAQFPVENVSWDMIQKDFLPKLNAREANSEWKYRLPTEAEWEYSCRGGATSKQDSAFDFYLDRGPTNDLSSADANFAGTRPAGNADKGTESECPCPVGSSKPNKLGLYDMHGNVWEWCDDPSASGPSRVYRGGGWRSGGSDCAAGSKFGSDPSGRNFDLGFRVARVPVR